MGYNLARTSAGNYLVGSRFWNGNRGAVTWADGTTGVLGTFSADNSLVGTNADYQAGFTAAIRASGIAAPLYLTQNDGTVMQAEAAAALPVTSFASGATNSMRGAAFLSRLSDATVVDVGRRGKWVVMTLAGHWGTIVIQPRMTGGFWLREPLRPDHIRLVFHVENPGAMVWYCDARRLGRQAAIKK